MSDIMITPEELEAFRRMRRLYLRRGRRAFGDDAFRDFRREQERVRAYCRSLDGEDADVIYWYYLQAYTAEAAGMRIYCSEAKVRRIRRRLLHALRRSETL